MITFRRFGLTERDGQDGEQAVKGEVKRPWEFAACPEEMMAE
jgi:hypothetical protein